MKISAHGVVSLFVGRDTQERFDLSFEEASAAIGYLDSDPGAACALWPLSTRRTAPSGSGCAPGSWRSTAWPSATTAAGTPSPAARRVYSKEEAEALLAEAEARWWASTSGRTTTGCKLKRKRSLKPLLRGAFCVDYSDLRTQLSRNASCSGVWNQCSPPGMTVSGA